MSTKKKYVLCFKTFKGWFNILYSSRIRAFKDLNGNYAVGNDTSVGIIIESFVITR